MPPACFAFRIDAPTATPTPAPLPTNTAPPNPSPTLTSANASPTSQIAPTPTASSGTPALPPTAAPAATTAGPPPGCEGASPPCVSPVASSTPTPGECDAPAGDLILGLCPTPILQAGEDDSGGTHGGDDGLRGIVFPAAIVIGVLVGISIVGASLYPAGAGRRGMLIAVAAAIASVTAAGVLKPPAEIKIPPLGGAHSSAARWTDPPREREADADAGVGYLLIADKDSGPCRYARVRAPSTWWATQTAVPRTALRARIDVRADCGGLVDDAYTGQVLVSDGAGQLRFVGGSPVQDPGTRRSWESLAVASLLAAAAAIVASGAALLVWRAVQRRRTADA
jgi:hypothetical protein